MRVLVLLVVSGLGGGCVVGAGGAVGYGHKRGFYAGVNGTAGVSVAHGTIELGGTQRGGFMSQYRLEAEANKTQFLAWHVEEDRAYFGGRAGVGYVRSEGAGAAVLLAGPDVAVRFNRHYCEGAPGLYVGLEYRWVGGESQFVVAPRYEELSDICLR